MNNSYMEFTFTGWVYSISETKITKNGLKYKRVVVTENGNYWMMFMFDNLVKLSSVKERDFVKIKGTIFKNSEKKEEFFKISRIQVLSKETMKTDKPSIDEDMIDVIEK